MQTFPTVFQNWTHSFYCGNSVCYSSVTRPCRAVHLRHMYSSADGYSPQPPAFISLYICISLPYWSFSYNVLMQTFPTVFQNWTHSFYCGNSVCYSSVTRPCRAVHLRHMYSSADGYSPQPPAFISLYICISLPYWSFSYSVLMQTFPTVFQNWTHSFYYGNSVCYSSVTRPCRAVHLRHMYSSADGYSPQPLP